MIFIAAVCLLNRKCKTTKISSLSPEGRVCVCVGGGGGGRGIHKTVFFGQDCLWLN